MRALRRLTTTIIASFEGVVGQIQNHDAVVGAAIREAEQVTLRAKRELARIQRDGAMTRNRVEGLREQAMQWEERAAKCKALDEAKAIECVRRRQRCLVQAGRLESQALSQMKMERQLVDDLVNVEEKLLSLRQQRNIMRTRQARSEAQRLIDAADSSLLGEIDDIFDRWEARISSCNEEVGCIAEQEIDALAEDFASEEESAELRAILAKIPAKDHQ